MPRALTWFFLMDSVLTALKNCMAIILKRGPALSANQKGEVRDHLHSQKKSAKRVAGKRNMTPGQRNAIADTITAHDRD